MKLKNYQEDVVLRAIEIALEDQPELLDDEHFVYDVAAYVLNRVPPRYVMSERGFLRLALEHMGEEAQEDSLANVIELMFLVNRGVEIVRERRTESPPEPRTQGPAGEFDLPSGVEYVHNYPQIIGRVLDATNGEPVYGAVVTMHIDGDRVPPAAAGWQNPYVTREQTRGHFSFWPHATRSEEETLTGEILFTVEHPGYERFSHVEHVTTEGAFDAAETISGDQILSLRPFSIEPSESDS